MIDNPYVSKKYQILDIRPETDIDFTYRVAFDQPVVGGQFVQVSIPTIGECPISISDFGEGYIDMTIRHVGKVTNVIKELKKGDSLYLRGPYGNGFDLENYKDKHLIVAAGGTGLAPIKKIIEYYYSNVDQLKAFDLLMGFRSPKDILFKDRIDAWANLSKMNVTLTVDQAQQNWDGKTGLITQFIPELFIPDLSQVQVVIVGPPMMMKFTAQAFLKLNIPEDQIWVSFERNMSCAVGKCGHCKIDEVYVCVEGPVFRYSTAKNLLD